MPGIENVNVNDKLEKAVHAKDVGKAGGEQNVAVTSVIEATIDG